MNSKTAIVICENPQCGQKFTKLLAEVKRSEKLGRQHFCSLTCYGQGKGVKQLSGKRTTAHLKKGTEKDEFSPFRHPLKIIRKSVKHRKIEASVTLQDLKQIWDQQGGICPYTGWDLVLFPCTTDYQSRPLTTNRASVDRIDSAKGYSLDNIQFVAVMANLAKHSFKEAELLEFCQAVYQNYKSQGRSLENIAGGQDRELKFLFQSNPVTFNSPRGGPRIDSYSPFRQHLNLARNHARMKGRECSLTLEDLKQLWERQGGRCVYTGWELENPPTTNGWLQCDRHPRRASLDRIDSTQGYRLGNVQFVAVMANYAKRDFPEEKLLEFCTTVVKCRRQGR
ncbi:hypothetical protein J0895_21975 [Phormidium pseudopriestleyi FRX01]|uniref:Uncharacterized protein n=1 Tax=Phormidium pseudopriestleyi FRX01 TaxID=1759528 RepID=A0ABS3FY82_9CYAN|nr:hypothetical protein [Phormidium pseudopriestleyi]MBO0351698.1 hypothetical protein [Phormidium pseudopriestleyi FRX01]